MLVLSIIACMPKCPVRVGRPSYCNSLARTTEVKADSIATTYGLGLHLCNLSKSISSSSWTRSTVPRLVRSGVTGTKAHKPGPYTQGLSWLFVDTPSTVSSALYGAQAGLKELAKVTLMISSMLREIEK